MTLKLQIFLILMVVLFLLAIIRLLKKNLIELRYSILWITVGLLLLLLGLFPKILDRLSEFVGIYDITNSLFVFALFFVLIMLLILTSIVSKQNIQNKSLTQKIAVLEKRIRDLEGEKKSE